MAKKEKPQGVKITVEYENKKDGKSLQNVIQKLFDFYIIKVIQNINKGK